MNTSLKTRVRRFEIRLSLLMEQAVKSNGVLFMVFVKGPNQLVFIPMNQITDSKEECRKMLAEGAKLVGGFALVFAEDGSPLVEEETVSDADPALVSRAKQDILEEAIAKGVLKPTGPRA